MKQISHSALTILRSNDLNVIHDYLKHSIPNRQDLIDRFNSPQTNDDIKIRLSQYLTLLDQPLNGYLSLDYQTKNITNLMVIAARGYLPLLNQNQKQTEIPSLINSQNNEGKTALHFALTEPENIPVIISLINQGANVNIPDNQNLSPLTIINDYSKTLSDIELRKQYQQLYDQLVPESKSFLEFLPADVIALITDDPEEILILCQSSRYIDRRYCQDENSDFWRNLYKTKFQVDPEDVSRLNKSLLQQYQLAYEAINDNVTMENKIYVIAKAGLINLMNKMFDQLYQSDKENVSMIDYYNDAMAGAAKGGHKEIVEMMLKLGATKYDEAMTHAAWGGNKKIVEMMIDKEADYGYDYDYNTAMKLAAMGGNKEIVEMMLDKGATYYNWAMRAAASGGHKEIVEMMLELGADAYDWAMNGAAFRGHKKIVKMMLDKGATDYDNTMKVASYKGHIEIVKMMLDKGATNYDEAIKNAAEGGHHDVVELIESYRDRK